MRSYYLECDGCKRRIDTLSQDDREWYKLERNDVHIFDRRDVCPECVDKMNA